MSPEFDNMRKSIIAFLRGSFKISMQILAARHDAAVCELDGPRMIGPMTSLKIPGLFSIIYTFKLKTLLLLLNH